MYRSSLPNLNREEKEFWDKYAEFNVILPKSELAKLQNIPYESVTTKGTWMWLYDYCGIQPNECLVKRINNGSHGYGDPVIEIRFAGADIMSIYRLSI